MKPTTDQQRKSDLIRRILHVKIETETIISNPQLIDKENRINGNIKAYTNECQLCNFKNLTGCKDCAFGVKKSCLKSFWHPKKNADKKEFQKALAFLEFILPHLKALPDYCFSEDYSDALREHVECLDFVFKDDYENKKLTNYKSEYYRQKEINSIT